MYDYITTQEAMELPEGELEEAYQKIRSQLQEDYRDEISRDEEAYRQGAITKTVLAILTGRWDNFLDDDTVGHRYGYDDAMEAFRGATKRRRQMVPDGIEKAREYRAKAKADAATRRQRKLLWPPVNWGTSKEDPVEAWRSLPEVERIRCPLPRVSPK